MSALTGAHLQCWPAKSPQPPDHGNNLLQWAHVRLVTLAEGELTGMLQCHLGGTGHTLGLLAPSEILGWARQRPRKPQAPPSLICEWPLPPSAALGSSVREREVRARTNANRACVGVDPSGPFLCMDAIGRELQTLDASTSAAIIPRSSPILECALAHSRRSKVSGTISSNFAVRRFSTKPAID